MSRIRSTELGLDRYFSMIAGSAVALRIRLIKAQERQATGTAKKKPEKGKS